MPRLRRQVRDMSLYIIGHSFVRRSFTPKVVAEFSKVIDDAYSRVKVTGQGGLIVPRLRRQVHDIERFCASVVIADIGEYLREISELRGVEAVVILPIMPRAEEAPANSRHCWCPDFEEDRLAVNRRVTDLVGAMTRVMTW